ncbi:hypothetical protein T229_11090 [Tannerella sp. oral taxon BU063 isolate Cell 5]|uniref:Uncharacterized protein n=1 Tax=Tannerella sp. oral taxon BU063 isolate Cell 5 TaxID=1410950 RepID=W2CA82_9BACT|nr:hypothetical protein T229_11090 [Tannerella sp. oral taxon BU063 isolate Cell 5]
MDMISSSTLKRKTESIFMWKKEIMKRKFGWNQ